MSVIRLITKDSSLQHLVRGLLSEHNINNERKPDLLIAELCKDREGPGISAIRRLRQSNEKSRVVVVSQTASAEVTQQAIRLGVDDFFVLPAQSKDFQTSVAAMMAGEEAPIKSLECDFGLVGNSANMTALRRYVARVALTDSNVLILGETGTGKELVAELIHRSGTRSQRAFVPVNAAAVPESLFESELFGYEKGAFTGACRKSPGKLRQAHGGTVFFDEIGDIGAGAQAKLLRAIESREVYPLGATRGTYIDVRLIAATNRDLDGLVHSREFRQDLLYRLDVVRIEMPALRNNREDIPALLSHFIGKFNQSFRRQVKGFRADAAELLELYDWPGNVRQLRNLVEACFVNATSDYIGIQDFPSHFRSELESKLDPGSRSGLMRALQACNWNISHAAWRLQCSRMTVYRKMARYRISRDVSELATCGEVRRSRRRPPKSFD
jgi:DNA-binding NtrC family response regulator